MITQCLIRVIINPTVKKSFSLTFGKQLDVKIMINNQAELLEIAESMEQNILGVYNYKTQFNWTNVPQDIQNNSIFREKMLKLFQSGLPIGDQSGPKDPIKDYKNIDKLVQISKLHIQNYGCAPNFSNISTATGRKKIHEYLRSHLARPNMSMEMALQIASRL
jgi:hypothetical protein